MECNFTNLSNEFVFKRKEISGWGNTNKVFTNIFNPEDINQIQKLIKLIPQKTLVCRGLGRSYGDAAQIKDGITMKLPSLNKFSIDIRRKTLTAQSGASFDEILKYIIPRGFFLPVSPGTKFVTVGGAIASDVHGKNHHIDGSFGNHVKWLKLIDSSGEILFLDPTSNSNKEMKELFWCTIGGMGLTGIILEACFDIIPIESSFVKVDTTCYSDLASLMEAMIKADKKYKYSVAWVDSLDKKGKGVLTCGEHALFKELSSNEKINPLKYDPKAISSAPAFFPGGLLNKFTVKAFNEAWFRKSPKLKKGEIQTISKFFYPLDGINNWNNIYGKNGFIQYQIVVPDDASELIAKILNDLRNIGAPSFLTVLKRFGSKNNYSPLSFPLPGWTLAVDVPAGIEGLLETLDNLDNKVVESGGRIYLSKDSRQSKSTFLNTYKIENSQLMKEGKFTSDMFKRLLA